MKVYHAGRTMLSDRSQESGLIAIIKAPGDPERIGMAMQAGSTDDGRERYQLHIGGEILAGYWIMVGDEFRPAEGDSTAIAQ